VKNIFLLDVTPLTRGIEISNGELNPIVKKNTPIPIKITKPYATAYDN
jgi:molecular chaperone DnaK (HSP70)